MNKMELFEAVGEIDGDLITRCENEVVRAPKQARVKWLTIAACFCLVMLCIFTLSIFKQTPNSPITPGYSGSQTTTATALLYFNQLNQEPAFQNAMIALMVNDYVPMTDDEFLNYYGVSFSIGKAVPTLVLQPQNPASGNGIYKSGSRGTYYDSHTFVFANDADTQRIKVTLSKMAYYPGLMVGADERDAQMKQSELGGFAVTIFKYAGRDGSNCFRTEFLNNGIAYCITAYNLSQEDYAAAITSVIADNVDTAAKPTGAKDTHTVTGTVNAVDENDNLISITVGNGAFSTLKIYLSDDETAGYSVGDQVEVTYVGNPITICTIWEQQLNSISIVKG